VERWGRPGVAPQPGPLVALLGGAIYGKLPDRVGKTAQDYALEMARKLMPKANPREQLHIQSRLQERGMWPGVGPADRVKKAQQSLDELLMLYEDDEEAWFWRAPVAPGGRAQAAAGGYQA